MKKKIIIIALSLVFLAGALVFSKVFLVRSIEEVYESAPIDVEIGEVTRLSGIELGNSILSIDENKAKSAVNDAYPDCSVAIVDIERVFPNKVIIYAKERTPVLAFEKEGSSETLMVTDVDFQIIKTIDKADYSSEDYIFVSGVTVDRSYNFSPFTTIRKALLPVTSYVPDYDLNRAIESVEYLDDGSVNIVFKNGKTAKYMGDEQAYKNELDAIF